MNPTQPPFEDPDLVRRIEGMADAAIHALPFGAIRLDAEGRVVFFSEAEATLSGHGRRRALGRPFFSEVAPCFAEAGFLQRIEAARQAGEVDIAFGHVGDFDDAEKELRVRILSAADGGLWIFVARD